MHSAIGMAAAFRAAAVRLGCSKAQPLPVPMQVCRPSLSAGLTAAAFVDTSFSMQQRSCSRKLGGVMAPRRHLQHAADRSAVLANYVETDKRSALPVTASASSTARLKVAVDVDEGEQAQGRAQQSCFRAPPGCASLAVCATHPSAGRTHLSLLICSAGSLCLRFERLLQREAWLAL